MSFRSWDQTSTPFAKFAFEQSVPYSEVLRFAEALSDRQPVSSAILTRQQCLLIGGLVQTERDRRNIVRGAGW